MRAPDYRCVFLGQRADEFHHVSGRAVDGTYFDSDLVVPLCRRMHVVEHQVWRLAGIGEGVAMAVDALRLRRMGCLLVRLGDHAGDGVVTLPSVSVRELGNALSRIAAEMDR
jgi:hypothetical protein